MELLARVSLLMRASSRIASERDGMSLDQAISTGRRDPVYLLATPDSCSRRRRSTSVVQPQ